MRVDERTIRETLRADAAQVTPPPDLWDRINRELDHDSTRPARGGFPRVRSIRLRQLVAVGVAAGLCWFLAVPAGPVIERVVVPPGHWVSALRTGTNAAAGQGAGDLRWSSAEIALLR
mgnify:CR=1 FL=1